jgi:hypothetical protein
MQVRPAEGVGHFPVIGSWRVPNHLLSRVRSCPWVIDRLTARTTTTQESTSGTRVQFDDETWEARVVEMSPSTELLAYAALALVAYAVALLLLWLWL